MATFIRLMGFVVLVLVVPCSAWAQDVADPGRPTKVRSLRAPTGRLFKSGQSTGFFEMLDFINRHRPQGQALTIEQFEQANEGYVTYVCRRRGQEPMRRRNGVFPLVNRTDEPIRWDTFCPDGRRSRELANGLYFREPAPGRAPLPVPVLQEQGAPDTATSQVEEPEQALAARPSEARRVPPERPTAPPAIPSPADQSGGRRSRSSAEFHAEESAIRELVSRAATTLLLFAAGALVAYFLMRPQNNRLAKRLQGIEEVWSSNGEGVLEPARFNEVLLDSILYQEIRAEWAKRFPALPFEEASFKQVFLPSVVQAKTAHLLQQARQEARAEAFREARAEAAEQLRAAEARHNRQQADARESFQQELERRSLPNVLASSSEERTSIPTLSPPRLGGERSNGQKPPSLPPDAGMGADPFPKPTPDQG